ncbi:hypothetical protein ADUPG1_013333, partial [Aduncisulcus paluster]
LKSIPSISIIPPIVTLKSPSSDGYIFATHVCSGMGRVKASHEKCKIPSYYNVLTGSEIKCRCLDFGRVCYTIDEFKVKDTVSEAADEIEKDEKEKVTSDTSNPELPQTVHSSLIQYTHPQHLLVKMTFTEERSMRQSMYDFIEQTGAGVEVLFDEQTHSFEGYNQYGWKEGMEIIVEEEEEENVHEEEIEEIGDQENQEENNNMIEESDSVEDYEDTIDTIEESQE